MKYITMVGMPVTLLICLIFYAIGLKKDINKLFIMLLSGIYGIMISVVTALWVWEWLPSPYAAIPVGLYVVVTVIGSRMLKV